MLEIVGIVRQNNKTIDILRQSKKYNTRPTQMSANAWGCLLLASHLQHYQSNVGEVSATLYLHSGRIKRSLRTTTSKLRTPTQCYTAEWEIYHQASTLLDQTQTKLTVCTDDMIHEREYWIEEAHQEFETASNSRPHRELLHKIQTVFLTINNTQVTSDY
jgi:hypothetical protein